MINYSSAGLGKNKVRGRKETKKKGASRNQGKASGQNAAFTVETSEALGAPFAFTSLRKVALDAGAPAADPGSLCYEPLTTHTKESSAVGRQ